MATQKASDSERPYLSLTESGINDAIIEARGDIFIAAQLLGITAIRLNRAIRVSPILQATLDTIPRLSNGIPAEEIHSAIESRISLYRVTGLDALAELATMPLDSNSAQNQVKLAAAARLAGETSTIGGGAEVADTLRVLNEKYHQAAPRIRVIRQTLIEMAPGEREIAEEHPPSQ